MKKIFIFLVLISVFSTGFSQSSNIEWEWAHVSGNHKQCSGIGYSIAADAESNVYVAGNFYKDIYFETDTFLLSNGMLDGFIAKINKKGNTVWVKKFGGPEMDYINSIITDKNFNIYCTGSFMGIADLGDTTFTSRGESDIFIAKYDSSGKTIWINQEGGIGFERSSILKMDNQSSLFLTGNFNETAIFRNIEVTSFTHAGDMFIAKYDTGGKIRWIRQVGCSSNVKAVKSFDIAFDRMNNMYITGSFAEQCYFGNDTITSHGSFDYYLAKYTNEGNIEWINHAGGIRDDVGNALVTDDKDNIYVLGSFEDSVRFSADSVFHSKGSRDIFLSKYDSRGKMLWITQNGGISQDEARSLTYFNDSLYTAGIFWENTIYFDSAYPAKGRHDIFISKFDKNGKITWFETFGGPGYDDLKSMTYDANGFIYFTGSFEERVTFGNITRETRGGRSVIIVKIKDSLKKDKITEKDKK